MSLIFLPLAIDYNDEEGSCAHGQGHAEADEAELVAVDRRLAGHGGSRQVHVGCRERIIKEDLMINRIDCQGWV